MLIHDTRTHTEDVQTHTHTQTHMFIPECHYLFLCGVVHGHVPNFGGRLSMFDHGSNSGGRVRACLFFCAPLLLASDFVFFYLQLPEGQFEPGLCPGGRRAERMRHHLLIELQRLCCWFCSPAWRCVAWCPCFLFVTCLLASPRLCVLYSWPCRSSRCPSCTA